MLSKIVMALLLIMCGQLSAAEPIPLIMHAGPGSALVSDRTDQILAFNLRTMVADYQAHGLKNEAWDQDAVKLLTAWAHKFSGLVGPVDKNELQGLVESLKQARCRDPMVTYCMAKTYEMLDSKDFAAHLAYRHAHAHTSLRDVLHVRRAFMLLRVIEQDQRRKRRFPKKFTEQDQELLQTHVRTFVEHMQRAFEAEEYKDNDRLFVEHFINDSFTDKKTSKVFYDATLEMCSAMGDKWYANTLAGWVHVKYAWWYRGGGWANTVTEEGWAGFHKHLALAEQFFTKAWQQNEDCPIAAREMISVAMGTETQDGERVWFDRSVAAEFDHEEAYSKYEWSIRPRWGGSYPKMLSFAIECAETKRHDTKVPARLMMTMYDIYGESKQFEDPEIAKWLFGDQKLWRKVSEVIEEGLLQHPQAHMQKWYKSYYAIFAWKFGHKQLASDIIKESGDALRFDIFKHFDLNPEEMTVDTADPLDDL